MALVGCLWATPRETGCIPGGNLTFEGTRTVTYDTLNRMTSATGGSAPLTVGYDPADRIRQTLAGPSGSQATTQFLYDGDKLIAEYGDSGARRTIK